MATRRLKKTRIDPVVKLAMTIVPEQQARRGDLKVVDVQNHTEADQRRMVRSGEDRTVRRQTHVERIAARLSLDPRETAACQWFADAHAARYDTLGTTGSYGESSRSGRTNFDHLPSTIEQDRAGNEFQMARDGIVPLLRPMFERVVLHGYDLLDIGAERLFRLAARQLTNTIEGWVGLDG
jgi:hypothetical protein